MLQFSGLFRDLKVDQLQSSASVFVLRLKECKDILMVQRNVFPLQFSWNLYFYVGNAFLCEGG